MQKQKFENLKEQYPDMLVLQLQGNFYKAFNDSAYVLSGMMDYKLNPTKSGYKCGFPTVAYDKVKEACELQRISYVVYDGETLVDQYSFSDNQFQSYCKMYGQENVQVEKTIKKEIVQEKRQALILVEGCGVNMTDALSSLKDGIEKEILTKGFRIVSLSVLEKNGNNKLVLVQGLAVYE